MLSIIPEGILARHLLKRKYPPASCLERGKVNFCFNAVYGICSCISLCLLEGVPFEGFYYRGLFVCGCSMLAKHGPGAFSCFEPGVSSRFSRKDAAGEGIKGFDLMQSLVL